MTRESIVFYGRHMSSTSSRPVALITGSGAGLGEALARSFGGDGVRVVVTDADEDAAHHVATELNERAPGSALPVGLDVTDADAFEAAVDLAERTFGRLDHLINNAGLHLSAYSRPIGELSRDQLRAVVDVNVLGVVHGTLAARRLLAASGGNVVNLSSVAAYGVGSYGMYGVTKLAVRGLTVAFAQDLAGDGIRVNAVAPGLIATDNAVRELDVATFDDFVGRQVLSRRGRPGDVVDAIRFLCSGQASFITGETLKVSGGYPLIP